MVRPIWSVLKYRLSSTRPWARSGTGPGRALPLSPANHDSTGSASLAMPAPALATNTRPAFRFDERYLAIVLALLNSGLAQPRVHVETDRDAVVERGGKGHRTHHGARAEVQPAIGAAAHGHLEAAADPIGPRHAAGGALGGLERAANRTAGAPTGPARSSTPRHGAGAESVIPRRVRPGRKRYCKSSRSPLPVIAPIDTRGSRWKIVRPASSARSFMLVGNRRRSLTVARTSARPPVTGTYSSVPERMAGTSLRRRRARSSTPGVSISPRSTSMACSMTSARVRLRPVICTVSTGGSPAWLSAASAPARSSCRKRAVASRRHA